MSELEITYRAITDLRPHGRNPRTHSAGQIKQLARSIKTFGFTNPVLIDDEGGILSGHGRVEAAKQLSMDRLPTVRLHVKSASERRHP